MTVRRRPRQRGGGDASGGGGIRDGCRDGDGEEATRMATGQVGTGWSFHISIPKPELQTHPSPKTASKRVKNFTHTQTSMDPDTRAVNGGSNEVQEVECRTRGPRCRRRRCPSGPRGCRPWVHPWESSPRRVPRCSRTPPWHLGLARGCSSDAYALCLWWCSPQTKAAASTEM